MDTYSREYTIINQESLLEYDSGPTFEKIDAGQRTSDICKEFASEIPEPSVFRTVNISDWDSEFDISMHLI